MDKKVSNYSGSQRTALLVRKEIEKRWGKKVAKEYDPFSNCLTFNQWSNIGFKIKRGEKSIRSVTFLEKKDEFGNKIKTYPKTVHLFFYNQVEPYNS